MKLLIVESPTKAKTISSILKGKYKVVSSFGHIRDLPKSEMGIDIEHNFKPHYIIPREKTKKVNELVKEGESADEVYFGTDEDREGEAISWHLCHILNIKPEDAKRIAFHEITDEALAEAIENPRHLDMDLVDAQQARRILDRLVGYELSPFLWKKVAKGLSAGRVQSVALRLVVEREREVQDFKLDEYWSLDAVLLKDKKEFTAKLYKTGDKTLDKLDIKNEKQIKKIIDELKDASYVIEDLKEKEAKRQPQAPFTTSSLQQEANKHLGFSAKQTMKLAQELYEGINLASSGHIGLITYMRTDSCNLSEKFTGEVKNWISKTLGVEYAESLSRKFKTKTRSAQEAHEAIRPTSIARVPGDVKEHLNRNQLRLYDLIWKRAVASQAKPARFLQTTAEISAGDYRFKANGNIMLFDGFMKISGADNKDVILPKLNEKDKLKLKALESKQHFTEPPARYSDATLVKALEEHGIGRPSTYAPIISTIVERGYVSRDENKKFQPKEIALLVNDLLVENFPEIVEYEFTAHLEDALDDIAEGKKEWEPVIREFYEPFKKNLIEKYKEVKKSDVLKGETKEVCEVCGAPMIVRMSRYGKFLACSAFPECKFTKPLGGKKGEEEVKESDEFCDKCGSKMLIKEGKYGKFLGCSGYPKCKNMKPINDDTGVSCPSCKTGHVVARRTKRGRIFFGCSSYPKCNFALWSKPTGKKCPECDSLIVVDGKGKEKCSNKECKS
ncbi:MAG: type I DNA topoisomerase [Parcubacteria group bacterium CG10_big_fil_rev_8_21_14_0_10_36_14]|nr:MAG: type I DNA topoisomerase [Parcubacteria group bacterium CG10_big_fil_rev_8_21_14_0_10_36_14]